MHLFKSAEHATRASAQRVNLCPAKVAAWLACLHMVCRMRLPVALYCLVIRLPCTSQVERAIGPRPCAWACDITDNYRLTSVAQLPSSSRRWRRCTSTDCAGALLAIFWCAHTLRPCTRTLRLKCNNRPALRFTTAMPPHLSCSPRLRRWLHRRRRAASSCSASSHRGLARLHPRRRARAPLAQH